MSLKTRFKKLWFHPHHIR